MRCSVVFGVTLRYFVTKYFVVFSRNQHRRLLPAMCHNLQDDGRRPPTTLLTTLACCSAKKQALEPDIGLEWRFLLTPPAFDTPVRGEGPRRNIAMHLGTGKLE